MKRLLFLIILFTVVGCSTATPPPPVTIVPFGSVPSPTPPGAALAPTGEPSLPSSQPQLKTFANADLGITFKYPADWQLLDRAPDAPPGVSLRAPAVGQGPEPIIFAVTIERQAAQTESVKAVVDEQLAQVPQDQQVAIKRQSMTVGGEPAEQIIGLPSRSGAIETFVLSQGQVFVAILQPYDPENEMLAPFLSSAVSAYNGVLSSWQFAR